MAKIKLNINNNNQTVSVTEGDTIELELAENATTGYCWYAVGASHELVIDKPSDQINENQAVGAGGLRQFTINLNKGKKKYHIHLQNKQIWNNEVYENFKVVIEVD